MFDARRCAHLGGFASNRSIGHDVCKFFAIRHVPQSQRAIRAQRSQLRRFRMNGDLGDGNRGSSRVDHFTIGGVDRTDRAIGLRGQQTQRSASLAQRCPRPAAGLQQILSSRNLSLRWLRQQLKLRQQTWRLAHRPLARRRGLRRAQPYQQTD